MAGILGVLRAAIQPTATAVSSYEQGQDQEQDKQRAVAQQSLMDQMKKSLNDAQISEANARGRYYDAFGTAKEDATSPWGTPFETDQGFMQYNKHTGEIRQAQASGGGDAGSGGGPAAAPIPIDDNTGGRGGDADAGANAALPSAKPSSGPLFKVLKPAKSATLKDANVVNPASGMIEDVYSDGSRKSVREATSSEIAKATHVPRDPNEAAPMTSRVREAYLDSVADDAIRAAGGDEKKAAALVSQDPDGVTAYSQGLATRHFKAAKERYDRQQSIDTQRYPGLDSTATAGPPPKPASPGGILSAIRSALSSAPAKASGPPPNAPSAMPPKPAPTGNINLGDQGGAASVDPAMAADPAVQHALQILKSKRGTIDQMMATPKLNDQQKAAVKSLFVAGANQS